MKSRRRIAFSKANDRVNVGLRHSQSNQEIAIGKIGALVSLRSSNPEPPMSALGHSLPGPAGRRSSHVRYAPKATFATKMRSVAMGK
jgi:hypothetical protein